MKKRIIVSAVLVCGMLSALFCPYRTEAAMAAGAEAADEEMEEVHFAIIRNDGMRMPDVISTMGSDGRITGDGVRLRKAPSLSADTLELMYSGELIFVQKKINKDWLMVKRYKTGTMGYVNRAYVTILN